MRAKTLTKEQFERKMKRYELILRAIDAGFYYLPPAGGFISWRLFVKGDSEHIGEYHNEMAVRAAMLRRAGVK